MENQNTDVNELLGQDNADTIDLATLLIIAANYLIAEGLNDTQLTMDYNPRGNDERVRGLIVRKYVYDKEEFLKLVKNFPHKMYKIYDNYDLTCLYRIAPYVYYGFQITRSSVCRKITRWECEPLLSEEEESAL